MTTAAVAARTVESVETGAQLRLSVRALGRRLVSGVDGCKSVSQCGLPLAQAVDGPGLILAENGRLVGGQLVACRSPLRCAWCSPMQWRIAEEVGVEYLRRHEEAGGWVLHTALTVPHGRHEPLQDVARNLMRSWGLIRKHTGLQRAKKAAGYLTVLSVLQVKWSARGGWHPHLHVGWLCVGPREAGEGVLGEVRRSWTAAATAATGRRASFEHAARGEVVFTALGFWKYCKPDDPLHWANDCAHQKHPGCWRCRDDDDDQDNRRSGAGGPFFDDPLDGGGPFEVLSGIGPLAVAGHTRAQALLAEYITGLSGYSRVHSTFRRCQALYGPVSPPDLFGTPAGGGPRVWVHPRLAADLELYRRPGGPSLDWGVARAAADPVSVAAAWSIHLNRPVEAVTHPNDGAPVLGFPDDLASTPLVDPDVRRRHTMTTNDNARRNRARLLNLKLRRMADEDYRKAMLSAVDDTGRGQDVKANQRAVRELHAAIIDFGDDGMLAAWEDALFAYLDTTSGVTAGVDGMALQANDARMGREVDTTDTTDDTTDDVDEEMGSGVTVLAS